MILDRGGSRGRKAREGETAISIIDKATGRIKQAVGDLTGDSAKKREGSLEERKGEEKEKLDRAEERVRDKAKDVADLERRT